MDGMTGDTLSVFFISKGDMTRIAHAKFHGILSVPGGSLRYLGGGGAYARYQNLKITLKH